MKIISPRDLSQAKIWYDGRTNTTGTPLIKHVTQVAQLILDADSIVHVLGKDAEEICRVALAHDALEDTKLTEEQLESAWGKKVSDSVCELSNKKGDSDFGDYINFLATKASESVRIVKLADILANIDNTLIYFKTIDINWIRNFWIPLLDRYQLDLFSLSYDRYNGLASLLTKSIEEKLQKLRDLSAIV